MSIPPKTLITSFLRAKIISSARSGGDQPDQPCPRSERGDHAGFGPSGRCGWCRARVGPPPWSVEVLALTAIALVVACLPWWMWPAYLWWALTGTILTFIDLATLRLPDRFTLPAAGGFLALLAPPALLCGNGEMWWRATLSGFGLAALAMVVALPRRAPLGMGDAKYCMAIGAATGWVGWSATFLAVLLALAALAGTGLALVAAGRARMATRLPAGPFLFTCSLLVIAVSGQAEVAACRLWLCC